MAAGGIQLKERQDKEELLTAWGDVLEVGCGRIHRGGGLEMCTFLRGCDVQGSCFADVVGL